MSGVILCTASYDHTIKFWEATTGACNYSIQFSDSVSKQYNMTLQQLSYQTSYHTHQNHQTCLNKPEQTQTNPNKPEQTQTHLKHNQTHSKIDIQDQTKSQI